MSDSTDVCLVLEGSYPFVTGGVSTWVDRHIRGLDEVSFSVLHLTDGESEHRETRYALPQNLVELRRAELDPERDDGFVELDTLPEARLYHALSTGLAGSVGARLSAARNRPLVLTEHGLSVREAALGLVGCKPLGCKPLGCKPLGLAPGDVKGSDVAEARAHWARHVAAQAREAYSVAGIVTTVCRSNARLQRADGAPADRLRVIPNAAPPAQPRQEIDAGPRIGFVGRVSEVKDVETFIRSCALVGRELPDAGFAVIGPLDHEPDYAEGCRQLAADLGLSERLTFTGEADPAAWYPRLDVLVLTSLSEAQPLVLLEAMSAGVGVVATAVGGCAELLGPRAAEGPAGLLTRPRDPEGTASAVLALCRDSGLRERLGRVAAARARRAHAPAGVLGAYRSVYETALDRAAA